MITILLEDVGGQLKYTLLEPPLVETIIDGRENVETLDGNVTTYVTFANKKQIKHKWAYMDNEDYTKLREMERRQYTSYVRPRLTIEALGIRELPVVLEVSDGEREIIDNCLTVQGVEMVARETAKDSVGG